MVGVTYSATAGLIWLVIGFVMTCSERWRRCGASVVASVVVTYVIVNLILKPLVCRDRPFSVEDFDLLVPEPSSWSFPSGHTASCFAGATAILLHDRRLGAVAMAYAAFVGVSRLYLCVHWPTDVLAGALIGVLATVALVRFMYSRVPYFADPVR